MSVKNAKAATATRSERREERRRKSREMKKSGKGFVSSVRNALLKRLREQEEKGKRQSSS